MLLFALLTLLQFFSTQCDDTISHKFTKFRANYKKNYHHDEVAKRLHHFTNNHNRVHHLNSAPGNRNKTVQFAVNKFGDKSREEFHSMLSKMHPGNHSNMAVFKSRRPRRKQGRVKRGNDDIPEHFDLRDVQLNGGSIIGPVKDQEECGCCWAFATTAISETANVLFSNSHQYSSLSDQEICDCALTNDTPGCVGGDPRNGLKFVSRHGQTYEYLYPYQEFRANKTGRCDYEGKSVPSGITTVQPVQFERDYVEEDIIENLYFNHMPSAVYFKVGEKFEWYNSGILQSEDCRDANPPVWHSAAIIGYGTHQNEDDESIDYWIVRNSWDTDWGEDGYVKVKRGVDWCEIESHPATLVKGGDGLASDSSSSDEN